MESTCDVLVIGAGPAGSAAALTLAAAGVDVMLADQHAFPRDKVCGDALIPDALRALDRLGVGAAIRRKGRALAAIEVHAPDGSAVKLKGDLACLPRRQLDSELRDAAVRTGARFLAPCSLTMLERRDGQVTGAHLLNRRDSAQIRVRSRFVVLATGAASRPLEMAGVCTRKAPSGIAVRAYFRHRALAEEIDSLVISYDRAICPGYCWIFPGPEGVINVGAGYFFDARKLPARANVREIFESFVASFPLASRIVTQSERLTGLKGAPLRTGLAGARLSVPGLLVAGEAAGTTYSFSGEGIGKALETGMCAAETLIEHFRGRMGAAEACLEYDKRMHNKFSPKFASYRTAQDWLSYPRIFNLLAQRANKGGYVRDRLEAMLEESEDPARLFSLAGLVRAVLA